MKTRDAKIEDLEQIEALAKKHKLSLPSEGKIIVVETEEGKIEGFVNLRSVVTIEPFICENPLAANKLWEHIRDRSEKGNVKIIRCYAQPKHVSLFKRLGFYRIFEKWNSMEINFY